MDPGEGTCFVHREFAPDVLTNILMRLPPNTRRLLRLVCRHWRDVVGTRTVTNLRSRAKTLVAATGYAYVVDDLSAVDVGTGRRRNRRELWTGINTADAYKYMNIVGTCNGLICLCDAGGDITVANPVTGEALAIPGLPLPAPIKIHSRSWHESYSFSYLPTARRYKLVHVPCWVSGHLFDRVQVITLGEASWRDVPAEPSLRSYTGYGVVAVDGWVYWTVLSERTERVMSFNLENERVAPIISLPSMLSDWKDMDGWHLAVVHERLGIVASRTLSTEVWVMEQGEWSRWYTMRLRTPSQGPHRCLTWPLFIHGEHVLAWEPGLYGEGSVLYRHTLIRDAARGAKRGVVEIGETARWLVVARYIDTASYSSCRRTFAYVETKEPLRLYMPGLHHQLSLPRIMFFLVKSSDTS